MGCYCILGAGQKMIHFLNEHFEKSAENLEEDLAVNNL